MASATAIRLRQITKRFEGTIAVRDVSLEVRGGEVLALLGENGAGKSTLVKILAGLLAPDRGTLEIGDRRYPRLTPALALAHGICLVQQELSFCPDLTVAENLYLGRPLPRRYGLIDYRRLDRELGPVLEAVGVAVAPFTPMRELSLPQAQLVELAKQLIREPKVLILDEATSALSPDQAERVYAHARRLADLGVAVLLITHRLAELVHADRAMVLRDGQAVGELSGAGLTEDRAVALMLGRELHAVFPPRTPLPQPRRESFRVSGLALGGGRPVSFSAFAGEILGIGGLAGQGQHELLRWLFGLERLPGRLEVGGRPATPRSPVQAMRLGIAYVPEERKTEALLVDLSVSQNAILPSTLDRLSRYGFIRLRASREAVGLAVERFRVLLRDPGMPIRQLSGGNQQKVALARWWLREPTIYLMEDPTRGIDVGSKHEIYELLQDLARAGSTVLLTSSDTLELVHLCHRVLVLYERELVAEYGGEELTEDRLVSAFVRGQAS